MQEALTLAQDLCQRFNLYDLVIALDAKEVAGAINKVCQGNDGAIISEINNLASHFNCSFSFKGRAANVEAHSLVSLHSY